MESRGDYVSVVVFLENREVVTELGHEDYSVFFCYWLLQIMESNSQ